MVNVDNIFDRKNTLTPAHFAYNIWTVVISENKTKYCM